MAAWPCKNPNCHSYGKPHPNCRCAPSMAAGGEAKHFCESAQPHERGCQYFAEGGTPDFIPDEPDAPDFIPDEPQEAAEFIPDEPDEPADFIPDESEARPLPAVSDANADLEPAELQKRMFQRAYPNGPSAAESPGQQLGTIAEGVGRGLAGPLFTGAELAIGVPDADIKARQAANPGEAGAAEALAMALPISAVGKVAGALGKAGARFANAANLALDMAEMSRMGQAAVKGAIELTTMSRLDDVSKAMLGTGNPEDATSSYFANGAVPLLGALIGGSVAKIAEVLTPLAQKGVEKAARHVELNAIGMGLAARGETIPIFHSALPPADQKIIQRAYDNYVEAPAKLARRISQIAGAASGAHEGLGGAAKGALEGHLLSYLISPVADAVTHKVGKYTVPTIARWMANGATGSVEAVCKYADKVARGQSVLNNAVDAIFKGGAEQTYQAVNQRDLDRLREYIDNGGIDANVEEEASQLQAVPGFAEGGEIKVAPKRARGLHDEAIAATFPEQNALIQSARTRISQYLMMQKPQKLTPQLPYDRAPDNKQADKEYTRALEVALAPAAVLKHVKDGTVLPDHIRHLQSMYPELTEHMRKKVTERVVKDQLEGKKPSRRIRQGLSLFLGSPLSSEFTPGAIQAAQSAFALKRQDQTTPPQQGQSRGSKRSTRSLSKSDRAYLTDDQAREARQQKV